MGEDLSPKYRLYAPHFILVFYRFILLWCHNPALLVGLFGLAVIIRIVAAGGFLLLPSACLVGIH